MLQSHAYRLLNMKATVPRGIASGQNAALKADTGLLARRCGAMDARPRTFHLDAPARAGPVKQPPSRCRQRCAIPQRVQDRLLAVLSRPRLDP